MEGFEGINIDLEQKNYRIELIKVFDVGVRMNLRRGTKDHGTMHLSPNDIDALIEGLQYMKEHIED